MKKIRSWHLGVGLVAMVLSMLVVFQLRTESHISKVLPTRSVPELAKMFHGQKLLISKYERENQELRRQLINYDRDWEIMRLKEAAGLLPLVGKGVRITLGDSEKKLKEYEDPVFFIVHYDQLALLVNELWAAGAEAIAINGRRVSTSTGFSCAGTTILIDTKRLAPPYRIDVIGDPINLKNALMMKGGFVDLQIRAFNLKLVIQTADEVKVPAYKGSISFEYAQSLEEGE